MRRIEIRRPEEEAPCAYCGAPLYVGDRAYFERDETVIYCSHRCVERVVVARSEWRRIASKRTPEAISRRAREDR